MKRLLATEQKLRKYPFFHALATWLFMSFRFIFAPVRFYVCKLTGRPYFGFVLSAQQCSPYRAAIMRNLLSEELELRTGSRYHILEVGSWAGQSAILWANVCKEKKNGRVFCIDHWAAAVNSPPRMKRAVKHDRIFRLFLHNIETAGLAGYVFPLKGPCDVFPPILKSAFDFIYIDGDHAYTQFRKDLDNYMPLLKTGGILCGDDLEIQLNEVDVENARRYKEQDCIFDPRSRKTFHPGVTLAIGEVFGAVSMKEGFWAIRKTDHSWETVSLSLKS